MIDGYICAEPGKAVGNLVKESDFLTCRSSDHCYGITMFYNR